MPAPAPIDDVLPDVPLGPAMAALDEKRRRFVRAYFSVVPGKGQNVKAAKLAGFGLPTSNPRTMSAIAARLMADERVAAAIAEVGQIFVRSLGAPAALALKQMIEDSNHRHHFRAVAFVSERIAPTVVNHQVDVLHRHVTAGDLKVIFERIMDLAQKANVPAMIDVSPTEKVAA